MLTNAELWLEEQKTQGKAFFAIVDPKSPHQPHVHFYHCDGENGGPLMSLDALTNPEDGPWLLPANEKYIKWWLEDRNSESGIIIASGASQVELRNHFASLFQAVLLGETVFFPFNKPDYIGEMLPRLLPEEITLLLGNHHILVRHNQEWESWQSEGAPIDAQSKTPQVPWWIIKEHHLDNTPNLQLLGRNIESWLWQYQPQLMQLRIENNMPRFHDTFLENFSALEAIPGTQEMTLQEKTLCTSVITTHGHDSHQLPLISETITKLKDDELLFGLRTLFNQLQGEA